MKMQFSELLGSELACIELQTTQKFVLQQIEIDGNNLQEADICHTERIKIFSVKE